MHLSQCFTWLLWLAVAILNESLLVHTGQCGQPEAPDCPPGGDYPVFFPDPNSCDKYYMCSNGCPYKMSCALSLWWDQITKSCVPSGSVPCGFLSTTTTTQPSKSTDGPTEPTIDPTRPTEGEPEDPSTEKPPRPTEPDPETDAPTTVQPPQPTTERFPCPADPFIYLPHDTSCELFYLCINGEFRGIFSCGTSYWFHSQQQVCVKPEDSDCKLHLS